MLTMFWDRQGVIMTDYFVQRRGKGIDGAYYASLIKRLQRGFARKRGRTRTRNPVLLVDNAPIHRTQGVNQILQECGFESMPHPPYSPDLAPSDYHIFKVLKSWQRGKVFGTKEELEGEIGAWFESKPASFYERSLMQLKERLRAVVRSGDEYLNEDQF